MLNMIGAALFTAALFTSQVVGCSAPGGSVPPGTDIRSTEIPAWIINGAGNQNDAYVRLSSWSAREGRLVQCYDGLQLIGDPQRPDIYCYGADTTSRRAWAVDYHDETCGIGNRDWGAEIGNLRYGTGTPILRVCSSY